MHDRFARRIEDGLESLDRRLAKARKKADLRQVEQQIDRLLGRNSRAARGFSIEVEEMKQRKGGLRVRWEHNQKWGEWAAATEGCYLLRANFGGWSEEELWQTYIQLTQAEAAFRIKKTDLSIRPIWHQKEERVRAHILVCFLAYVLWKMLEQWQSKSGLGNSPRTILQEMARIQSMDVVLPLVSGREVRIRCVVKPDRAQSLLLQRLGLTLPSRLGVPVGVPKL